MGSSAAVFRSDGGRIHAGGLSTRREMRVVRVKKAALKVVGGDFSRLSCLKRVSARPESIPAHSYLYFISSDQPLSVMNKSGRGSSPTDFSTTRFSLFKEFHA